MRKFRYFDLFVGEPLIVLPGESCSARYDKLLAQWILWVRTYHRDGSSLFSVEFHPYQLEQTSVDAWRILSPIRLGEWEGFVSMTGVPERPPWQSSYGVAL